ncbi:MAG: hypothetical protein PHO37_12725 [Kiritimatiellae bacterium]|nr:hypothetical protein [Kiritimatiellia bacterium]
MKIFTLAAVAWAVSLSGAQLPAPGSPGLPIPFAQAAGQAGTTAIHMNSPRFVGWADGYRDLSYGAAVADNWKTPAKALGKAKGTTTDIVCLGSGGRITLTFSTPIANGAGFDFAVFENAFDDNFLELAWVEVSSDGIHFCRFPNYYVGKLPVGAGSGHNPEDIYGLASKYRQGYGTPFDLQELQDAYDTIRSKKAGFLSAAYQKSITDNFPHLDLDNISYVKIIDIVGDGSAVDATGLRKIYDPYPTTGSAGFDLDAIGVINQRQTPNLLPQQITFTPPPHQLLAAGSLNLSATSSSGLPVVFAVTEGPAILAGTTLNFTGSGTVIVTASQPGDASYAPAANVVHSIVIAEHTQHIYLAPVPNLMASSTFQLYAASSCGLPVGVEVFDGAADDRTDSSNRLTTGRLGFDRSGVKIVTLRAFQNGDAITAPAADVFMQVKVINSRSADAPQSFADWCAVHKIAANRTSDDDGDGFNNFDEFMAGTSPVRREDKPDVVFTVEGSAPEQRRALVKLRVRRRATATLKFQHCESLNQGWHEVIPKIKSLTYAEESDTEYVELELELPADAPAGFYRARYVE